MATALLRLRRSFERLAARTGGNPAVEFGLAAPFLILLAFGAFDYGSAYIEGIRLNGAARAGVQKVLLDSSSWQDTDEFEQTALEEYVGHGLTADERQALPVTATSAAFCSCLDDQSQTLSCSATCPSGPPARYVRVTLTRNVSLTLPYPWRDGDTMTVAGEALARVH